MKFKLNIYLFLLSTSCVGLAFGRDIIHPKISYPKGNIDEAEKDPELWHSKAEEALRKHLNRKENTNFAKNIILFLGDGMSIPTLTATRVLLGNENKSLSFEEFPYTGLSKTYCVDGQTADSACSATAYLCGVKGNDGTIGVSAKVTRSNCEEMMNKKNHVTSIAQWAQEMGKATGIVTTTRVTHASPAGTYANTADRDWESDSDIKLYTAEEVDPEKCRDIAYQLVHEEPGKNFKVILGGGRKKFLPFNVTDEEGAIGERVDNRNLIDDWKTKTNKTGKVDYVWNKKQLQNIDASKTDYLLGLFESSHCKYHLDVVEGALENKEPSLGDMVSKAIEILSKEEKGFFLFVEGGRIDHAHHDNLPRKALDETIELSKAVEVALKKTKEEDTLIVVTADHSHTLSMSGYPARGNDIFGVAFKEADDGLPMATLNYANGPSYYTHTGPGKRRNYSEVVDTKNKDFEAPSLAPLSLETHGADDVAVFARGPWAHLFTGSFEQNLIPHIMTHAAQNQRGGSSNLVPHVGLVSLLLAMICRSFYF